ncbi:hypothetical protein [Streptomyces sp. 1222.5]|uniref:hypothetical protein n=1 Tax=Streptomyces sp. 1222.5 TaxID=1881026 RepID=UPI003D75AE7D
MIDPVKVSSTLSHLMPASRVAAFDELPRMVAARLEPVGVHDVAFFIVDLQGTVLREVTGLGIDAGEGGETLAVDATVAGRAFQRVELIAEPTPSMEREGRKW